MAFITVDPPAEVIPVAVGGNGLAEPEPAAVPAGAARGAGWPAVAVLALVLIVAFAVGMMVTR